MVNPEIVLPTSLFEHEEIDIYEHVPVYLFQQWFHNPKQERYNEYLHALQQNIENEAIDKIYLLNEQYYHPDEYPILNNEKIEQIVVEKRLTYQIIYNTIRKLNIDGYCIFANLDIFFDSTLTKLRYTNYGFKPTCIVSVRQEYYPLKDMSINEISRIQKMNLSYSIMNKPEQNIYNSNMNAFVVPERFLSVRCQDSWIIHTSHIDKLSKLNNFDIQLGTWGCDNKILCILYACGFEIINATYDIAVYHYHTTNERNYERLSSNGYYGFINSYLSKRDQEQIKNILHLFYNKPLTHYSLVPHNDYKHIRYPNSIISLIYLSRENNRSFHISYFDIPSIILSKLYIRVKTKKIISRDLMTKNKHDIWEMILYNWFITSYHTMFKKYGIYENIEYMMDDLHYLASLYAHIMTIEKRTLFFEKPVPDFYKIRSKMDYIEDTLEKSDILLYDTVNTDVINTIMNKIPNDNIVEHILKLKQIECFHLFNPLLFRNQVCWTHSLSGLKIGVVSKYNHIIQQNMKNYYSCYDPPLFLNNEIKFIDLPTRTSIPVQEFYKNTSSEDIIGEFYEHTRRTSKIINLEYINYGKMLGNQLDQVDIVFIDAGILNLFITNICMQKQKPSIVLGKFLRLYFGVYTENDKNFYNELINITQYWKKV